MPKRKKVRERGKIRLSEYFKELSIGEKVALKREQSISTGQDFPKRMRGRTGVVVGKKGRAYIVKVKDLRKEKEIIVKPINLKRISSMK